MIAQRKNIVNNKMANIKILSFCCQQDKSRGGFFNKMNDSKYNNNVFLERASKLIFNSGKTQAELVKALGLSNGTIANLKNKKGQVPSADTVCALSNYFNVSTDWLLGLTDTKSTDKATQELCATLGLNEETINILQEKGELNSVVDFLFEQHVMHNKLLSSDDWENALKNIDHDDIFIYRSSLLSYIGSLLSVSERTTDIYLQGEFLSNENCIKIRQTGSQEQNIIKTNEEYGFMGASLNLLLANNYIETITSTLKAIATKHQKNYWKDEE